MSESEDHPEKLDRFERDLVFRVSRSIYIAFAVVGTITIVCAALVLAYAMTPTLRGFDPEEPVPPVTQKVSPEEVLAAMSGEDIQVEEDWDQPSERPARITERGDPNAARIAELMEAIEGHFEARKPPWRSKVNRRCAKRDWWGDCERYESKVTLPGAELRLHSAMESLSSSDCVLLLEAVLSVVSSVAAEPNRFLGLWSVTDLKAAYERYPEQSLAGLNGILRPTNADGGAVPPPPDDYKSTVFTTLLEITKASTSEETLVQFLTGLGSFAELTTNEQAVALFTAVWSVVETTEAREAERRMDELLATLAALKASHAQASAAVSGETQVLAIATYASLRLAKEQNAEWAYGQAVAERDALIAEQNETYDAARERKSGLRRLTLLSILGALGGIAVIGLFLGLLAVERNTRVLGQLAERMAGDEAAAVATDSKAEATASSAVPPVDAEPSPGTSPDLPA
jgi:hypothetical protein